MRLLTSESQVAAAYGDCGVGGGLGLGLMSLSGTPKALSDPNQAGRGFGAFGVIIGVVGLVAGGLVLGSPRGADLDAPDLWQVR